MKNPEVFAVVFVQHTFIVAPFALPQKLQLIVWLLRVQFPATNVKLPDRLAGQFVVVLHVYQTLVAVMVLHTLQ